jgi:hypothetical protein
MIPNAIGRVGALATRLCGKVRLRQQKSAASGGELRWAATDEIAQPRLDVGHLHRRTTQESLDNIGFAARNDEFLLGLMCMPSEGSSRALSIAMKYVCASSSRKCWWSKVRI